MVRVDQHKRTIHLLPSGAFGYGSRTLLQLHYNINRCVQEPYRTVIFTFTIYVEYDQSKMHNVAPRRFSGTYNKNKRPILVTIMTLTDMC